MKQKFDVEVCGTERKLTIKKCTKGDEASYTCLSPDNRRTSAELFIKMPVFKIEKDLENMEVMMGDAVKMVVKLSTSEMEGCKWYFDGEEAQMTNPDFQFIRDMDTFTFEIAEGFLRESCFVTFEATKSLHTQCNITVKEKPIKWEDRLPDLRVREGREIVLPCKLSRPDVSCDWYFNEDPVENNKRTRITHNFF